MLWSSKIEFYCALPDRVFRGLLFLASTCESFAAEACVLLPPAVVGIETFIVAPAAPPPLTFVKPCLMRRELRLGPGLARLGSKAICD